MSQHLWKSALCLLPLIAAGFTAQAQAQAQYPERPIRFVVPMPPGGGTDYWARLTASKLEPILGTQVIVENKPGGGTIIAADYVARAPADGYTIMVGDIGTFAVNPGLHKTLPYAPLKDFSPITLTTTEALVLTVPANSPLASVEDLVRQAKAEPGKLNYGSASVGSPHHLAMELLQDQAGVQLTHIPYKGSAPIIPDLLGGALDAAFLDLPVAMAHLKSGRLKGLAVFAPGRLGGFPDLPTMREVGLGTQEIEAWKGLVVPDGVAPEIIDKLNAAYRQVSQDPDFIAKLQEMGVETTPSTPEEFSSYMAAEMERWTELVKAKNISM